MLNTDPFGYVFQLAVLCQPLLWMNLLHRRVHIPERFIGLFYLAGYGAFFAVAYTGFTVGFYKTHLILQYIVLTTAAVYFLNQRYDALSAISLGFLLVYLNSFYWEFPMHLAELMSYGFNRGMFVQYAHLVPLLYLIPAYEYTGGAKRRIYAGFCLSVLFFILRYQVIPHRYGLYVYALNKAVCLALLVRVFAEAELRKPEASRVGDGLQIPVEEEAP